VANKRTLVGKVLSLPINFFSIHRAQQPRSDRWSSNVFRRFGRR